MPQGDQRGAGWQFYDTSYDGIWDGSLLRQGLGQLTDGKLGPDNFKASYYDQDRGKDKRQVPVDFSPPFRHLLHGFSSSSSLSSFNVYDLTVIGWVGWRNDSRNGQPVEIVFEFDTVRDFTSLSIFANNQFTKDVQVP
jgi:discoidin domain receptor family protein 2